MPNLAKSKREAKAQIISMAQQANPNPRGQSDDFLAQPTAFSKVVNRIPSPKCSSNPIYILSLKDLFTLYSLLSALCSPLFPLQRTFFNYVEIPHQKYQKKNSHLYQTKKFKFSINHCPGIQENNLYIENDEKNGDQIEFYRKPPPGISDWLDAAFVSGELLFGGDFSA
jgi:hypothetical protein